MAWLARGEQTYVTGALLILLLMGSVVGCVRKVRRKCPAVRVDGPGSYLDDVAGLEVPQGKLLGGYMHQNLTEARGGEMPRETLLKSHQPAQNNLTREIPTGTPGLPKLTMHLPWGICQRKIMAD